VKEIDKLKSEVERAKQELKFEASKKTDLEIKKQELQLAEEKLKEHESFLSSPEVKRMLKRMSEIEAESKLIQKRSVDLVFAIQEQSKFADKLIDEWKQLNSKTESSRRLEAIGEIAVDGLLRYIFAEVEKMIRSIDFYYRIKQGKKKK